MPIINCKKCHCDLEVSTYVTKYCKNCCIQIQRERCKEYKRKNKEQISIYNFCILQNRILTKYYFFLLANKKNN